MIDVDISNIWGNIEFHSLIQMEERLTVAAGALAAENEAAGCSMNRLLSHAEAVFTEAAEAAGRMMQSGDAVVVICSPIVHQYIRAAVACGKRTASDRIKLYFTGQALETDAIQRVISEVQKTDFSVLVIGKVTTIEEAIALRRFKWLLNRKYGPEKALERILVTEDIDVLKVRKMSELTDAGRLFSLGAQESDFPFSACMIPIAAAGLNPEILTDGIRRAEADLKRPGLDNPLWLYAAARVLLCEHGEEIEEFHLEEAALQPFGHWCCQLYAETDRLCERRIHAILNPYAGYAYRKHTFETTVEIAEKTTDSEIELDLQNDDGLNYLAGKRISQIEACVAAELSRAKAESQFPTIMIRAEKHSFRLFGYLTYFIYSAAKLSAWMLTDGQPGVKQTAVLQNNVLSALEAEFKSQTSL